MPTASITASGPRPSVSSRTAATTSTSLEDVEVEHVDAARSGPLEPLGDEVDADHVPDAAVAGDPRTPCRRSGRGRAPTTLPPVGTPAYSTACHAVGSTSDR